MKVLHIADIHIGTENYGRIDPATGLHTRLLDFVNSLKYVFDKAIEEDVDLVAFAGDTYKSCDPNPTHQREFAAQVRRLAETKIPMVMVVGNHDHPVSFGRATALDIFGTLGVENIYLINRPDLLIVNTKSGPLQIVGIPWPTRSLLLTKDEYKNLSDREITEKIQELCERMIEGWVKKLDLDMPSLLLGHLAVAEAQYSGSERTALLGREPVFATGVLANPAFDYVALGHIHKFQDLNPKGKPHVVYSGSIERIDFGEENEQKGFCIVELKKGETSYRFVPTPARRFITINVQVEKKEEPTKTILREIEKYDIVDAIVRVIYSVPEGKTGIVDMKLINQTLKDAFLIAGVVRKTEVSRSTLRTDISESTGILEALDKYISRSPEMRPFAEELKNYAAKLESELELNLRG